jgi:hypothetical protein
MLQPTEPVMIRMNSRKANFLEMSMDSNMGDERNRTGR